MKKLFFVLLLISNLSALSQKTHQVTVAINQDWPCQITGLPDRDIYRVYPNPVHDILTIEALSENSKLTLSSAIGKRISLHNILSGNQLDVRALNDGLYFLSIENTNTVEVIKLIVQHK